MRLPAWVYDITFRMVAAVVVVLLTVGGAYLYTRGRPNLYESTARIWVQAKPTTNLPGQSPGGYAPLTYFFNSPISTAAEVMNSTVVLSAAIKLFKERFPALPAPDISVVRGNLKVQPVKDADIVVLSYRDGEPNRAYAVVASVLDAFILVNSTQASGSAVQSRVFLERQLETARAKYSEARHRLKEFQEENRAVDLPAHTSALLNQAAELRKQIDESRAVATEQRGKVLELTRELNASPAEGEETSAIAEDTVMETLEKKLADDEVKLVELRTRLLENHPRIERLKSSIEKTRKWIHDRQHKATKRPATALAGGARIREKLMGDLSEARAEEVAANNRIALLTTTLEQLSSKMQSLPAQHKKLAEVTRAEQVAVEALNDIERSLHSARLVESVASETSNIQIIDRPEVPDRPTAANMVRNVGVGSAIGFVAAAALFVLLMYTDPYVRKFRDIAKFLDLPVLGWLRGSNLQDNLSQIHRVRFSIRNWLTSPSTRIVLLSQESGEGKTAVAVALAMSFAQSGIRTLLIDCNLRNAQLHRMLNVSPSVGLSDVLPTPVSGEAEALHSAIREVSPLLFFLDAGARKDDMDFSSAKPALLRISSQYQVVIFDTPPLADSATALALLDAEANVVIPTKLAHTTKQSLKLLAAQLKQQNTASGGIVLTNASESDFAATLAPKPAEVSIEPTAAW